MIGVSEMQPQCICVYHTNFTDGFECDEDCEKCQTLPRSFPAYNCFAYCHCDMTCYDDCLYCEEESCEQDSEEEY